MLATNALTTAGDYIEILMEAAERRESALKEIENCVEKYRAEMGEMGIDLSLPLHSLLTSIEVTAHGAIILWYATTRQHQHDNSNPTRPRQHQPENTTTPTQNTNTTINTNTTTPIRQHQYDIVIGVTPIRQHLTRQHQHLLLFLLHGRETAEGLTQAAKRRESALKLTWAEVAAKQSDLDYHDYHYVMSLPMH